ncbi:hypothetical protein TNCV_3923041 [Trichonephila clavipes]|nr:hypothetical protein TNCV_3923041 [Trichonephila clavipes]
MLHRVNPELVSYNVTKSSQIAEHQTPDRKAWFTCRNCGGGDRGRRHLSPFRGSFTSSLNRTVTSYGAQGQRQAYLCPCHDESVGLVLTTSDRKLTVWCALWAGGILLQNDEGHNVTVNGDRYRAMIINFFIPELNNHDVHRAVVPTRRCNMSHSSCHNRFIERHVLVTA